MFVRDFMTSHPITITQDTPIFQALEIIKKHKVRHLPVLKDGRIVGLVTERGLLTVSPSPATTLSVYELNYVLAKVTVREAMVKNPVTVAPDCPIEEAGQLMWEKRIGSLLVTDGERLVGILTQTDMIEAVVRLLGLRKPGARLVIETHDRIGVLAELTQIFRDNNINIRSVATIEIEPGKYQLLFRLNVPDVGPVAGEIERRGFQIISIS